jgi:hypothetical protein
MKSFGAAKTLWIFLMLVCAVVSGGETRELHFKSPAPGMRFTAGLPLRVWADIIPRDDDHPGWPQCECHWDNQQVGVRLNGNKKAFDFFPFIVPAAQVTAGVHALKLSGFGRLGETRPPERSLSVEIDPWPTEKKVVELDADLKVTDLDWTNVAVRGNGHTVTLSGALTIKNSLITGLGSLSVIDPSTADANSAVMTPGITGTLNGDVVIQDSIFEATGALQLKIEGAGKVLIKDNEFRASNFIKFVPSNPEASPVFQISGTGGKEKLFQGNRVGAGIVRFENTSGWLVGGENDSQSNILMGPRCVLSLVRCSDMRVSGNYIHHDYRGTWSQGYNFYCEGSEKILAEHNVLRASSWPLQSFSGEFRYNLMIDSGHNWVRTLGSGTRFHHNLLVHTGDPYGTGIGAGVWNYGKNKDVQFYNNTFDGGAPVATDFNAPMISISSGCTVSVLRNNVFTGVNKIHSLARNAIVARGGDDKDTEPRIASADYNCFFNPQAPAADPYDTKIVSDENAGEHDIHDDPMFKCGAVIPYAVDEAEVWNRKFAVSKVLTFYRERYAPAEGSPLLNPKGFIGAIGDGKKAEDLFGRFLKE